MSPLTSLSKIELLLTRPPQNLVFMIDHSESEKHIIRKETFTLRIKGKASPKAKAARITLCPETRQQHFLQAIDLSSRLISSHETALKVFIKPDAVIRIHTASSWEVETRGFLF